MYLLRPITPATTGPLLMPMRTLSGTRCSSACSRVMWTMRIAMRTMRSAWLATGAGRGGEAANGDVGIAYRLDLLDAEFVGGEVETGKQAVQQRHDVLRRHLGGKRGEADQIGKGHRDLGKAVGDALLALAQAVGDRRRQHVQEQLLVLAVLGLDDVV